MVAGESPVRVTACCVASLASSNTSQSSHRLELLREAGYVVEAVPSAIAEPDPAGIPDLQTGLVHIAALKVRDAECRGAQGLIFVRASQRTRQKRDGTL